MYIILWSNALYISSQQINIPQITILLLLLPINHHSTIVQLKLNQSKCWFLMRGEKPKLPGENLSEQSREPTNAVHIWRRMQKLNATSALTTRPTLTPISIKIMTVNSHNAETERTWFHSATAARTVWLSSDKITSWNLWSFCCPYTSAKL